jgi:hypothetical protein
MNIDASIAAVVALGTVMSAVLIMLITSLSQSHKKTNQTTALAQVTGREENPIAFAGPSRIFSDTDLAISLETKGNPVLITFQANATIGANSCINMRPTINGTTPDGMTVQHFAVEAASPSLSFSRAYQLPQGTHNFRVQFSCEGTVSVRQRWMIVQELN